MKHRINRALALLSAVVCGLIFGTGLILAGMANPAKVIAFLDIAGLWDPSLGFVMGGAIAIGVIAFSIAKKRRHSYLGLSIILPTKHIIDKRLVLGSLTFGAGWGLAGICPAPALILLGSGISQGAIFVIALIAGMAVYELLENRTSALH